MRILDVKVIQLLVSNTEMGLYTIGEAAYLSMMCLDIITKILLDAAIQQCVLILYYTRSTAKN